MKKQLLVLVWFALVGTAMFTSQAAAQVFTPTFQPPRGGGNIGVYLSDGPGDFAIEGIFRQGARTSDLGFRVGLADVGDGLGVLVGADLRNPLALGTAPVDFALTLGGQGLLGDISGFGFQGGLSIGSTFRAQGFNFTPYIHPRLALVNEIDNNRGQDGLDLDVRADVGFDLTFPTFIFRFGANLGRGADFGVGVAFR